MDVDIDQLSSERAAEGGREVARLDAEDDVPAAGTVVVDLEVCDVERSCVEIARGRIGVIAWTVVIAGRVADVEDLGPGNERSEEHTSELQSHHDLVCRLLLE